MSYTQAQIQRMEEQDEQAAQDVMQRIMGGDLAALEAGPKPPAEPTQPAPALPGPVPVG
jgi:hypothetical protein